MRLSGSVVVVDNRYVVRCTVLPSKADAPLLVDANTVFTGAIAFQELEAIARRCTQIAQRGRGVQLDELSQHHAVEIRWEPAHALPAK